MSCRTQLRSIERDVTLAAVKTQRRVYFQTWESQAEKYSQW